MKVFSRATLALLLMCIASYFLHSHLPIPPFDDAYIHLRIVENWIRAGLPYYNLDQPLMGSSSPLWIVALRIIGTITTDLELSARLLNSLFSVGAALCWSVIVRAHASRAQTTLQFFSALTFYILILPISTGLMETPLALFLLALAILQINKNSSLSILLSVLAALTRFELLLFLPITLIYARKDLRQRPLAMLTPASLVAITYLGAMLYYFAAIIPQSIGAKKIVYTASYNIVLRGFFNEILGEAPAPLLEKIAYGWIAGVILFLAIAISTLKPALLNSSANASRRKPAQFLGLDLLLLGLALISGYLIAQTPVFPWYAPLATFPLFTAAMIGLSTISTAGVFTGLVLLTFLPLVTIYRASEGIKIAGSSFPFWYFSNARINPYREIALALRASPTAIRIMAPEIGALGYFSKKPILDAIGLVSPEALKFHPLKVPQQRKNSLIGALPTEYVKEQKPEIIIGLSDFLGAFPFSPEARKYNLYFRKGFLKEDMKYISLLYPTERFWSTQRLFLYVRKDVDFKPAAELRFKEAP